MAIRRYIVLFALVMIGIITLAVICQLCLGGAGSSDLTIIGNLASGLSSEVPGDARQVASQADIDALPDGAVAVLTGDTSDLVLSRAISLYGAGHKAGSVTLAADGVRVSGLVPASVVVKGDNCVVDHCTVNSNTMNAIRADRVDDLKVLGNVIYGNKARDSTGVYATNCTDLVIDGNAVSGAYISFDEYGCTRPLVSNNYVSHVPGFRQGIDFYMESSDDGVFRGNRVEFSPYSGPGHAEDHDAIGFNRVDGMLIEDNIAEGHYYTLKIYNSRNCVIQNNTLLRAGSMRTGFYDSNLVVRNNRISGEPLVGRSIGIWINDGTVDSIYEGNEIWDCEYGIEESHYPEGYKYLEGSPSLPCSNITLKNNYIHDCSSANVVIMDKGSCIEIGNYDTPTAVPRVTTPPSVTVAPSASPSPVPSATAEATGRNPIIDFFESIIRLIFG